MSDPGAKRRLMEQLADSIINDLEFREQMRQDSERTAEGFVIPLDDEERQALRDADWSLPDEQLTSGQAKRKPAATTTAQG